MDRDGRDPVVFARHVNYPRASHSFDYAMIKHSHAGRRVELVDTYTDDVLRGGWAPVRRRS